MEDVSNNRFFRVLKNKYSNLYKQVEQHCYTLCIPQSKSLEGLDLNSLTTFKKHILKPSPFLVGIYDSLESLESLENQNSFEIEDNCIILSGSGINSNHNIVNNKNNINLNLSKSNVHNNTNSNSNVMPSFKRFMSAGSDILSNYNSTNNNNSNKSNSNNIHDNNINPDTSKTDIRNSKNKSNHMGLNSTSKQRIKIKILSENLFYNQKYQSFKVLLIECPFEGGVSLDKLNQIPTSISSQSLPPKRLSVSISKSYLQSFPENEIVLNKIDEQLLEFNKTYVLVKNFEPHARSKIDSIYNYASDALICANPVFRMIHKVDDLTMSLGDLYSHIELYIYSFLHCHLYPSLLASFATVNSFLSSLLSFTNSHSNSSSLTVPATTTSNSSTTTGMIIGLKYPAAPEKFFRIFGSELTPLERINLLEESIQCVQGIEGLVGEDIVELLVEWLSKGRNNKNGGLGKTAVLTKLNESQKQGGGEEEEGQEGIWSSVVYMREFGGREEERAGVKGYYVTSLEVAVEYIMSEEFLKEWPEWRRGEEGRNVGSGDWNIGSERRKEREKKNKGGTGTGAGAGILLRAGEQGIEKGFGGNEWKRVKVIELGGDESSGGSGGEKLGGILSSIKKNC